MHKNIAMSVTWLLLCLLYSHNMIDAQLAKRNIVALQHHSRAKSRKRLLS